jgi:hypothetical protein
MAQLCAFGDNVLNVEAKAHAVSGVIIIAATLAVSRLSSHSMWLVFPVWVFVSALTYALVAPLIFREGKFQELFFPLLNAGLLMFAALPLLLFGLVFVFLSFEDGRAAMFFSGAAMVAGAFVIPSGIKALLTAMFEKPKRRRRRKRHR